MSQTILRVDKRQDRSKSGSDHARHAESKRGLGRSSRNRHPNMMERDQVYHSVPDILGGTPVFRGTRVPIDTLLVYLRKGKRIEDFRDDFPTVSREQAEALLKLAEQELLSES